MKLYIFFRKDFFFMRGNLSWQKSFFLYFSHLKLKLGNLPDWRKNGIIVSWTKSNGPFNFKCSHWCFLWFDSETSINSKCHLTYWIYFCDLPRSNVSTPILYHFQNHGNCDQILSLLTNLALLILLLTLWAKEIVWLKIFRIHCTTWLNSLLNHILKSFFCLRLMKPLQRKRLQPK